ncbi:hypothetical protein C8Q72DRAFT_4232 [Fomitopsis betulina]|nr:hypothetical protein C8Q72DRAFT_4232 [Fomitopsis betulina]
MYDHQRRLLRTRPQKNGWAGRIITWDFRLPTGVSWICRVQRRNANSPPIGVQYRVLLSEAATLQLFSTRTSVPVSHLFDVAVQGPDNDVGYILMEKLESHPLCWQELDSEGQRKVLEQFAVIFAGISNHPIPAIVSSILTRCRLGPLYTHGQRLELRAEAYASKFSSALDMCLTLENHQIQSILTGEIYVDEPVIPLLVYRYLIVILPTILPKDTESDTQFFPAHIDDKGDHILGDGELNITGIVD